ncbi:P2Y purinoceptor 3-like [Amia ocellicauda]|uniref:P2Y purinoceptor 3-like n=1 Tax=Amia ocellicauda TaxID=2972642 RepID=UPI0034643CED|nr:P2RY3 protein [Amia calva]
MLLDTEEISIRAPSLAPANRTQCPVRETYKRILLPLTYSLVFILGVALNGTLLWQIGYRSKNWSCSIIYLVNLAVADLLYVLSLPLLIVNYAMDDVWLFGNVACKAVRFFFYTNLHGSMMFLMCISVHRFLGVCFPMRSIGYRTRKLAITASAATWILVAIELLPTFVYAHTGFINNRTVCFDLTSPSNFGSYFPYGVALTILGFLIPFLIICICYCSMIRTLWRPEENITAGRKIRRKSIRTILVVCLLLLLCFVPFHITRMIYLCVRVYLIKDCAILNVVMLSYKMWRPIVSCNSCINPLLYFLSTDKGRNHLLGKICKNKVHPSANNENQTKEIDTIQEKI